MPPAPAGSIVIVSLVEVIALLAIVISPMVSESLTLVTFGCAAVVNVPVNNEPVLPICAASTVVPVNVLVEVTAVSDTVKIFAVPALLIVTGPFR